MYAEYFAWRGMRVAEAATVALAEERFREFTPEAVVIVERSEDMAGVEVLDQLRRPPFAFAGPIVLLTADVFRIKVGPTHRNGASLVVPLPCLPDALHEALVTLQHRPVDDPDEPRRDCWLFLRRDESVWIVRPEELELRIKGPGTRRQRREFTSELELVSFQADYERLLLTTGFRLESRGRERRAGARAEDRRRRPPRDR